MKHAVLACTVALATGLAFAQANPQDHEAHHPEAAATAPAPDSYASLMQRMQDMHRRLQAAKTPAERQALLGEHMDLMRSGMEMMGRMGQGTGGMGMGMGAAPSGPAPGNPPGPASPGAMGGMGGMGGMMAMHGAMERRMAMMEQMMQMMVDREAAVPRR